MSEKILVVDDEESIRASLAGILEDENFIISFAGDGVMALEMVAKEMPDLVLLDIWMPRMDGIETLQKLKGINPELVVIMMSGHGTIETAVKSTKMGAYDFIEKPLSLEKLLGYSPYLIKEQDGKARLLVGAYLTREGAESLYRELESNGIQNKVVMR